MIARPRVYEAEPSRARLASRAARTAADRRRARTLRSRYTLFSRILVAATLVTVVVCAYLALMANVTRMNYQIAKARAEESRLLDQTARNEDRIARLESRERLAAVAASLRMHEAARFVLVRLPEPPVVADAPRGLAFLSSVAPWFGH